MDRCWKNKGGNYIEYTFYLYERLEGDKYMYNHKQSQ